LRIALGITIVLVGVVTAAVAALVSRMCWRPDPVTVPYGLALAVAGSMAVVVLGASVSRGFGLLTAVGWIVGLVFVVNGTSGGSFVVAGDALGWSFLVLGTLVTLGTALWGPVLWGSTLFGKSTPPGGGSR
jgi:vacuolar-type H+-ATPase subunit I/STV1